MGDRLKTANTNLVAPTIDWLITPARVFTHPDEVLRCLALDNAERRAILASWASDARAVEGRPALRQLESGSIVSLTEVLAALRKLDRLNGPDDLN